MTDAPHLTDEEIEAGLPGPQWRAEGAAIVADATLADFSATIAAVNRVAAVAEAAGHHPDILVHGWNHLRLTLSTHSVGGVTAQDLEFAARLAPVLLDAQRPSD